MPRYAIGFDFGEHSVRILAVDVRTGQIAGRAQHTYESSPKQSRVWLDTGARACREMIDQSGLARHDVIGIGVAFVRSHAPFVDDESLSPRCAKLLGLRGGIPVSAAILDTHARVPGCGVASPSTVVMVLGADAIHLMNSRVEAAPPGMTRVVEGGILPGYFGYEITQPAVGIALERLARIANIPQEELDRAAARLPPGSDGISATGNWRKALLEGNLHDAFARSTSQTHPAQRYRALIEAIAFELRSICESFRAAGVPVRRFVADGDLPRKSPLLMQTYADVLDARIKLAQSHHTVALGAAVLGCLAAGTQASGHASMSQAIHAMAPRRHDVIYRPDLRARKAYDKLYASLWPLPESAP